MRLTLVLSLLCCAGAASLSAQVPVMNKVQPDSGKIGSVLRIQGVYLGKTKVDEVYLTDHTFDMKVKVLDQTDDSIEFRVPPFAKPGRLQLVVKTVGKEPIILEQPVYVTIEDGKEPKETLQATATATPPPANGTK
ncbi:MAG: IPT/TIG domain-containing protein [Bryobacteraceae bacterium]